MTQPLELLGTYRVYFNTPDIGTYLSLLRLQMYYFIETIYLMFFVFFSFAQPKIMAHTKLYFRM